MLCLCRWVGEEEGDNKDAERAGGKRGAIPEGCYSYLQGPLGQMPKASLFLLTATCCPHPSPSFCPKGHLSQDQDGMSHFNNRRTVFLIT